MSRKRKIGYFQTTAVDRISECPDSVLSHILSLLPIKDAVKTEVLSKRWQFLWTFLPSFLFHFHFSYSMYDDSDDEDSMVDSIVSRTSNFVTFVDKTLFFSNCSKLKKFGVDFGYVPHDRFKCEFVDSIRGGKGRRGAVMPKGKVAWNSLNKLAIGYVELSEDVIERILAGLLASLAHVKNLTLGALAIEVCSSAVLFCNCILDVITYLFPP
ncbi:hypothetical protein RHSIM_Rhsim13G0172500 [Rhododendron simsii]|uniref:F-box domain-containing protein n=1 Tax=Rhododendron simsii TaxID=118357 RepID=A0A834G0K7_RHOSS|nr:hypothetical protein RHSIM_Rhsim13G0172500 [Rhododendron simsii]